MSYIKSKKLKTYQYATDIELNILNEPDGWLSYLNSNPTMVFSGNLNRSIIDISRKGVAYSQARYVFKTLGLDVKQMSDIIGITDSTFQRNLKDKKTLNINQSEKVLEAGVLLHRGLAIYGLKEAFIKWLHTETLVFNGMPIQYIDTNIGINLIVDELNRIEFGIY